MRTNRLRDDRDVFRRPIENAIVRRCETITISGISCVMRVGGD